jgi:hypothetical protein
MQIRDVYSGSRIRLFPSGIPDPGLTRSRIPSATKNLNIFYPQKNSKIRSEMFITASIFTTVLCQTVDDHRTSNRIRNAHQIWNKFKMQKIRKQGNCFTSSILPLGKVHIRTFFGGIERIQGCSTVIAGRPSSRNDKRASRKLVKSAVIRLAQQPTR